MLALLDPESTLIRGIGPTAWQDVVANYQIDYNVYFSLLLDCKG